MTAQVAEVASPLQRNVNRMARQVSAVAVALAALVFGLRAATTAAGLVDSFVFALGVMVALVPEGLPATLSVSLAIAVRRMATRHALIKRLAAVETLGSTTVICTDKTGTLTEAEMTVTALWESGRRHSGLRDGLRPGRRRQRPRTRSPSCSGSARSAATPGFSSRTRLTAWAGASWGTPRRAPSSWPPRRRASTLAAASAAGTAHRRVPLRLRAQAHDDPAPHPGRVRQLRQGLAPGAARPVRHRFLGRQPTSRSPRTTGGQVTDANDQLRRRGTPGPRGRPPASRHRPSRPGPRGARPDPARDWWP